LIELLVEDVVHRWPVTFELTVGDIRDNTA